MLEKVEDRRLLTTIDLASLSPDQGSTLYGADAGDVSGWNPSSTGDFNGDGYDDVVISAYTADGLNNTKTNSGEVYVVFGGPGFSAQVDLGNLGTNGMRVFGADDNGYGDKLLAGTSGDFNGDGFDDLLLSASGDGPNNSRQDAGEVYVVYGAASLPQSIDLATPSGQVTTIYGAEAGDLANRAANAGDFNGDGIDDVMIGAMNAGPAGPNDVGAVYFLFGGQANLPSTIDLATPGASDVTILGSQGSYNLGYSINAAGDVNGDGVDDIVVGDYHAFGRGAAHVFYGSNSLVSGTLIDLDGSDSADITILGAELGDQLGRSVDGAGDFNGDGFDDLILGSNSDDLDSYVIFGASNSPATIELNSLGSAGVNLIGAGGRAAKGAGDVNGDGLGDVIVGDRAADGLGGLRPLSGTSYVVFGTTNPQNSMQLSSLGSAGITVLGVDADDQSGAAVGSVGDVNGDGYDDFVIGAITSDGLGNAEARAGESYVIFGGDDSIPPIVSVSVDDAVATEGDDLTFTISLSAASNDPISVSFATSDGTAFVGSDYISHSGQVSFVPGGSLSQTISVTTVDDSSDELDETLSFVLSSPINVTLGDSVATGTIVDNDSGPSTKFYVANDAGNDKTYEYATDGTAIENYSLDGLNSAPRGVATTTAGDRVWVVDASLNVHVYDSGGNPLGSWYASGIGTASKLQGIATDGTDIWIVDDKFNKVHRFADAASVTSGVESPSHSFDLIKGNKKPTGITTDGNNLWIVNNGNKNDKVFKYDLNGTKVGNWKLNTSNASQPTGITLDPSGASDSLWIVDKGTDRVYEYENALNKHSGKLTANSSFPLAAGNTNPQGIADPPPASNAANQNPGLAYPGIGVPRNAVGSGQGRIQATDTVEVFESHQLVSSTENSISLVESESLKSVSSILASKHLHHVLQEGSSSAHDEAIAELEESADFRDELLQVLSHTR